MLPIFHKLLSMLRNNSSITFIYENRKNFISTTAVSFMDACHNDVSQITLDEIFLQKLCFPLTQDVLI